MAYTSLTAASIGDDVILTSTTTQAFFDNPIAIAQRMTNAPVVQVPVFDVKTSGTAATWTWPDGVTAVEITLVGGGGGGGASAGGTSGTASTITYNSVTVTAGGGANSTGAGGTATNGTLNFSGMNGGYYSAVHGGDSGLRFGIGGEPSTTTPGTGYGAGGGTQVGGSTPGGGGGACAIYRVAKVAGLNTITYTVGVGGTGNSAVGDDGANGTNGVIIFKY